MAHAGLNTRKFHDCLDGYRANAARSAWQRNELRKFFFANSAAARINPEGQTADEILAVCADIEIETLDFEYYPSRLRGVPVVREERGLAFARRLADADVRLIQRLAARSKWSERDFATRTLGFTALSSWLGTLLPTRFVPAPSTLFRHSISYLFDLDLKLHQRDDFAYFIHAQKFFYQTKNALRREDMATAFLPEIAEALKRGPSPIRKSRLDEVDLNWLTEDFHLFVVRDVLGLDARGRVRLLDGRRQSARTELIGLHNIAAG